MVSSGRTPGGDDADRRHTHPRGRELSPLRGDVDDAVGARPFLR